MIEQIKWKLMTFSLNSKKSFLTHFPNIWGKNSFFKKIQLCHTQLQKGF